MPVVQCLMAASMSRYWSAGCLPAYARVHRTGLVVVSAIVLASGAAGAPLSVVGISLAKGEVGMAG
jgi:hypothetical protein